MQDPDGGIIIIGAGGHAKVVLSTLLATEEKILGFVDDNPKLVGTNVLGYKVLGDLSLLDQSTQAAVIGIGNNRIRQTIANRFTELNWKTIIHPDAYIHESVKIGVGTVVFAGAVIQLDTFIGDHVIVNTATSIDHDCIIRDFVHIAPGSHLAGRVIINEGCFMGIKSCAIDGMTIGKWSTLGAGSVVVKSLGDYVSAKGVPAKVYKTI